MNELIEKMLSLNNWAVAGSTHRPDKFAYKIYKKLKSRKYNVFSLNLGGHSVDDDISYKSLHELPVKPDVINMVINPLRGREIIDDAISLGIKYIWFQPGAESQQLINTAREAGLSVVYDRCVLVELG